ncbi:unnamed protein product [Penicillium glandicola]
MSQQPNEPPVRTSMSSANIRPQERSPGTVLPLLRSDRGSFRQTPPRKNEGRASGEFEGSTLGSGSRDGDRRTPGQRRTQSSSGFLLDALPRPRSTRVSLHRPRPSEPPQEKRSVPTPDIVVPKKRSRFPWSRHKKNEPELVPEDASSSPINAPQASTPPDRQPSGSSSQPEVQEDNVAHSTPGLDRDSIQIVNLALNLNESRRRTASGIPPGSEGRRPISISQPAIPTVDNYAYSPRARNFPRDSSYRNFTQASGNRLPQGRLPSLEQSSVVNLLPPSAIEDHRAHEFSESTLARAERARNHFDLFHEYMRLLPSLPPLRNAVKGDAESNPQKPNRGYNPIQMIRNRKVRYREKCSIDADAEGWHDVERVHQWINNVEQKYSRREYGQLDCLKLPPFQQGRRHISTGEQEDMDMMPTSPQSSLRRASRTSSIKARRPRIDWKISPAELLADAAWLEDGANKTKVVDKDGYKLYPDPTKLVTMERPHKQQRLSVELGDPGETHSSPRTSLSNSRPALAQEFKSVGRGRHRHRFRSHSHSLRSRSASSKRKPSRWDHVKMRSASVSSSSSSDTRPSVDEKSRMSREHIRDHVQRFVEHAQSGSRISRAKSPAIRNPDIDRGRTPQPTAPLSLDTKQARKHRKGSFSSAGSLDDRHDPRMSLEGMDSTAPNSPAYVSYFPSIAVNLSPPSSRSPSPAKKGLRHKIVSRHERSKSKQADREREREDELPEPETLRQQNTALERVEGASKLEPSPLPDIVSSSYPDDLGTPEGNRVDGHRPRKGPHAAESKLRGIFKGPGRIAEIVGNEVSKVGDLILKKDADPGSRKSSSATTFASDDSESDEESRDIKKSGSKSLLRRLPTFTDEPGRLTRRNSEKNSSRAFIPSLPTFTSPLRQDERSEASEATDFGSPRERLSSPQNYVSRDSPKKFSLPRSKTLDFSPSLHTGRTKHHDIQDPAVPFSLTRPPVTGLANARASPGLSPGLSPEGRGTGLSGASRAWSISGRSIHTLIDTGVPGKPEVERTRALLLSSGIKAREITRRSHTPREPVPPWLQNSVGPGTSVPRVTRIGEFDLAAQCLLRRFEHTQHSFQQSMHHFSTSTSLPLRTQLRNLEDLVNHTLAPRVRTTANDAEDLCVHLNTTSTLAVKQLSDALDRGLRKRRRRLRWVRRTGFMVLEWALVAMLWWVWLIVMAFKLVRGVFRGAFSGNKIPTYSSSANRQLSCFYEKASTSRWQLQALFRAFLEDRPADTLRAVQERRLLISWDLKAIHYLRRCLRTWILDQVPGDAIGAFLVTVLYEQDFHLDYMLTTMVRDGQTQLHIARRLLAFYQIRDETGVPIWDNVTIYVDTHPNQPASQDKGAAGSSTIARKPLPHRIPTPPPADPRWPLFMGALSDPELEDLMDKLEDDEEHSAEDLPPLFTGVSEEDLPIIQAFRRFNLHKNDSSEDLPLPESGTDQTECTSKQTDISQDKPLFSLPRKPLPTRPTDKAFLPLPPVSRPSSPNPSSVRVSTFKSEKKPKVRWADQVPSQHANIEQVNGRTSLHSSESSSHPTPPVDDNQLHPPRPSDITRIPAYCYPSPPSPSPKLKKKGGVEDLRKAGKHGA